MAMWWLHGLLATEVALAAMVGCGGEAARDVAGTGGAYDSDASPGADAASDVSEAATDVVQEDDPASCTHVGEGPGIESCCAGRRCLGVCVKGTLCRCDQGEPPPGGCPLTAACCPDQQDSGSASCISPSSCVVE